MSRNTLENSAVMTAAEFRVSRERLNVSGEWLAQRLDVALRTVRRWEAGTSPVSNGVALEMFGLLDETEAFVAAVVEQLLAEGPDATSGGWHLLTFADDATFEAHHPDSEWCASWHRAAMGRVTLELPSVRLVWAPAREQEGGR
ncbi:helix-turn-helix domain-containing protein [Dermacoccus barathri]|uniref:helix-turn-helix domain-containing protein n=1 Tax=Dermacoccus barathri TaxID=322601 RepID=UPI00187AC259|nr:transcriptional regulator [Dermacoccus barathri]MBE7372919.1 transcriptional regulator [Dermacoccus barathri]